eukprot:TRINITY_DN16308_c0_g1_i1.p1 TRINITY_DN16308_c0_g1~~TRINITY_DN16308_c0_g1_i1.p1  ORF type:complete len:265 (+),score=88.18 TRINITY_DN16308_c0_g1_i1:73-867(+)
MARPAWRSAVALSLLGAVLLQPVVGEEPIDPDADLDLDDEDFDTELPPGAPDAGENAEPVEDFDKDLSEGTRKERMQSCFDATLKRLEERKQQVRDMVQEMKTAQSINDNMAANSIAFSWAMTCYLNAEDDSLKLFQASSPFTEAFEMAAFGPKPERPQQVQQASRRQWSLLEEVVKAMGEKQKASSKSSGAGGGGSSGSKGPPTPTQNLPGSGMSASGQAMYMLVVLGVFFGVGALVVMKLGANENVEKKSGKAEKAEKKKKR